MKLKLNNSYLPKNFRYTNEVNEGIDNFYFCAKNVNLNGSELSNYIKKNLEYKLSNIESEILKYAYVLSWSLEKYSKPLSECVFVDYGAGYGMLGMIARACGIGNVIYNDIYPGYCEDFRIISKLFAHEVDHVVSGDISVLSDFLKEKDLLCDCIGSYDVLEHIYDLPHYVRSLKSIPHKKLNIFKSSGANIQNIYIRRILMKQAHFNENFTRAKGENDNPVDCYEGYKNARMKIISSRYPNIAKDVVERLAFLSRGLIEKDIILKVESYSISGIFPELISHPTNTCNPYTGSWDENLIDHNDLIKLFENNGFNASIIPGRYFEKNKIFLNVFIKLFGKYGCALSPFYSVKAYSEN